MPRYSQYRSSNSIEYFITIGVIGLAIVLFFTIVFWPSAANPGPVPLVLSETTLGTELSDATTDKYLLTLHRVRPDLSAKLHAEADGLVADGAEADALAAYVMLYYSTEIDHDQKHLMRADVDYWDQLTQMTQNGLRRLSNRAPQFCRMSYFSQFESLDPELYTNEVGNLLAYDSEGYHWSLRAQTLLLEAVENGRRSRQDYDRLTSEDERVLQMTMMNMMQGPQVAKLMRVQTLSAADQQRALANMNLCDVGVELLAGFQDIPQETKERMMGELQRGLNSAALQNSVMRILGGF